MISKKRVLDIEILYFGDVIGNAIFSFNKGTAFDGSVISASTKIATDITLAIVNLCETRFSDVASFNEEVAASIFSNLGGGLSRDEYIRVNSDSYFDDMDFFEYTEKQNSIIWGLTAVTKAGIAQNRKTEDEADYGGKVKIDAGTKEVNFSVFKALSAKTFSKVCCNFDSRKLAECPFKLSEIPFQDVKTFLNFVNTGKFCKTHEYGSSELIIEWED